MKSSLAIFSLIVFALVGVDDTSRLPAADPAPAVVKDEDGPRRQVRVTSGYALDCEGNDLYQASDAVFDLIERIDALEASGQTLLTNGDGTVCLRLDRGADGLPVVGVEAYGSTPQGSYSWLDGTLWMDFYDHCLKDLINTALLVNTA